MTKKQKLQLIETLISMFSLNKNIYLIDIFKMNSKQIFEFRKCCYNYKARFKVVKNNILRKALEKNEKEKWLPLINSIKGNTSIITSETNNIPAKIIKNFRKTNNSEYPFFKAAYIEESFYIGNNQIDILVNIKSKEELISDLINILQNLLKSIISSLKLREYKILDLLQILLKK